ncbi:MAG: EAL domain-containing protein, partial [Bacillota bacterium]
MSQLDGKLLDALRGAIGNCALCLHYQPSVDLHTGQMVSIEALVCWSHPDLGLILPDQFIPAIEDDDLIVELDQWAVRQACLDLRAWNSHGFPDVHLAINLASRGFADARLIASIEEALAGAEIDPAFLALEIRESALMRDPASAEAQRRLRELGVSLVLDDFGTGYSSLCHLKQFTYERVKIGSSVVGGIVTNADEAAVARAVIAMAHNMGSKVVAVGVETVEQCEFLRSHMCDEIQGPLYSRPLPANELEHLLREGGKLPNHFPCPERSSRTLLLVDDESNILAALKRLLRRDGYNILTANGGQEGLELLAKHDVDVIVSDQRMPGMTGVEFLRHAKGLCPDTVRIVLSGYTELQSVTDAVNEGAIFKFLTKPWDDALLRQHIADAFHQKELADENRRLGIEVSRTSQALVIANRQMEDLLRQKQHQIARVEASLEIVREILQHVAVPLLGLDEDGNVVFANDSAASLLTPSCSLLGCDAKQVLPELSFDADANMAGIKTQTCRIERGGTLFQ